MKDSIRRKLEKLDERFEEISRLLSDPGVISRQNQFRELSMEYSRLGSADRSLSRLHRPRRRRSRPRANSTMEEELKELGAAHRRRGTGAAAPARAQGSARRQQHLSRGARRHRRRRGGDVRRRSVPHVRPLRRIQALGGRDPEREPRRARRLQGNHQPHHRPRRLFAAEIRIGHASRAARAGHRGAGPHSHLRLHGGDLARAGGGRGRRVESRGPAHRHLPLLGRRRPARQQDRLRDPHHPHAHRHRGRVPGRTLAAQESLARHVAAEGAPARRRAREAGSAAGAVAQTPGRLRRSLRAHPHLQFSAGPRHRSPHQPHALQARRRHERQAGRADRRAQPGTPGRRAGQQVE